MLIFSGDEQQTFSRPEQKEVRDTEKALNRRVVIYLFRPGSHVTAATWPCPRADEAPGACYRRFWADADSRRTPQSERRLFEKMRNTFACRFYERIGGPSPCETVSPVLRVRLYDRSGKHIPLAPFRLTFDSEESGTRTPTGSAASQ